MAITSSAVVPSNSLEEFRIEFNNLVSDVDALEDISITTATTTAEGKSELATTAETVTGTDTARVVTPAGLHGALAGLTDTTIVAGDAIIFSDASDSGAMKEDTVQGILDLAGGFTLGTEQAATSGTSVTFTGIPSGTTMIIVMLEAVSFTAGAGTDLDLTIGDSGGLETAGYVSTGASVLAGLTFVSSTASFVVDNDSDGDTWSGQFFLTLKDSSNFTWICSHSFKGDIGGLNIGAGDKSLSAELTQLSLSGGTFDGSGSINIMYQ